MRIVVLILGILILLAAISWQKFESIPKSSTAQINGHVFSLYLATTPKDQEVGLAKFSRIDNNQGMLFIFKQPDYYSFWMKDMQFPIDIIFISNNNIVDIFQNVPVVKNGNLPVYTTTTKADKVLEINAGLSKKYDINVGDKITLNL
jgi:uncharacterized membrane protein (UPF0127 family)